LYDDCEPGAVVVFVRSMGVACTFRLLDRLFALDLAGALRARIIGGIPYLGASAGALVACPTIRTTNDIGTGPDPVPDRRALSGP